MDRKRKTSLILTVSFLLIGILLCLPLFWGGRKGAAVQVRVDGSVVETFPLEHERVYQIVNGNGGTNLLRISGGEAWLEEASCPDKLCVKMGRISRSGQSIICLPNKVTVEIIGETAGEPEVDAVSGGRGNY